MRELTPKTAAAYLRETGRVPGDRAVAVRALGWGVSNLVLRVEVEGRPPIVLKQSRERLRTEALWVSRLDRIWTERAALELLGAILPRGTMPEVLFSDEENYLLAMSCAPDDSTVWKARLLAGEADPAIARRAGLVLGQIHAETAGHPALAGRLADTLIFDQLRLDPFYRTVARVHPDLRPTLDDLLAGPPPGAERTFVHADFSPKNILVHGGGLTLVDFETAHAGDPAFDLGFFVSHLLLKAFWASARGPGREGPYLGLIRDFWAAYRERAGAGATAERVGRSLRHAAACALARLDGKSPVDYLDDRTRPTVRRLARAVLRDGLGPGAGWEELLGAAAREMRHPP